MAKSTTEAGSPRRPWLDPSLGTRIFLATAVLVTLAVGCAVAATYFFGQRIASQTVRDALERSSSVLTTVQEGRLGQLRLIARIFAGDPYFAGYVAEAVASGDRLSILDQLEERRSDLGFDFAIVLDAEGNLVARTDDPGGGSENLAQDPLVQKALDDQEAFGVWSKGGELYYVGAVFLEAGGLLQGYLIVGTAIDDLAALELRRITDTEIAFLVDGEGASLPMPTATTLDSQATEALVKELGRSPDRVREVPADASPQELVLAGQRWLTAVRPLHDVDDKRVGEIVSLASLDEALAPFHRLLRLLIGVGVSAILVSLLVSYLLPRRVLQPMRELAVAAEAAAEGDYDQAITTDRQDEVGKLATAFSTLLSELREQRDMETYVKDLARNIPEREGVGESRPQEPPSRREATVLGIELRGYARLGFDFLAPGEVLEELERDLRRVALALATQKGELEAIVGHRVLASFVGERRTERALAAAAEVLAVYGGGNGAEGDGKRPSPALALVSGSLVRGPLGVDERRQRGVAGLPVEQLEGLLRVARAGTLLLDEPVYEALAASLQHAGVQVKKHRSSVSEQALYSVEAQPGLRRLAPELSATQVLTEDGGPQGLATLSGVGPGSLVGNRFEILSVLGSGGMGVVYKARDRTLDELVALKMLKNVQAGDSAQLDRLKDELKLARKISHPNVLRTFDFGEVDGMPFITMEYVRGITLKHLLEESGRLPFSAGLRLARQLCRGLTAAHSQAVLHRDIKPENLLIEHTGNAKLMDFGIARPIHGSMRTQQTQPGTLIGTPYYLAPEQLEGKDPDERADLYASGVVLYEIFTGKLPYEIRGSLFQVINQKLTEAPTSPRQHWPGMPPELERIILRCLERDRDARFPTAATLLAELEVLRV